MAPPVNRRVMRVDFGFSTECYIPLRVDGRPIAKNQDGYCHAPYKKGHHSLMHGRRWEELHGKIPHGLILDHLCRNRACCNPDHLEAVPSRTNTRRGEKAKLTMEEVIQIRALWQGGGLLQRQIGEKFGISPSHVSALCGARFWNDGPSPYKPKTKRLSSLHKQKSVSA